MSDALQTSNAAKTIQRREKRKDATIEVTFGEKSAYTCPECGNEEKIGIYGSADYSPTFGNCSNWDCDAFLKFVDDGERENAESVGQADLGQFVGGETA